MMSSSYQSWSYEIILLYLMDLMLADNIVIIEPKRSFFSKFYILRLYK